MRYVIQARVHTNSSEWNFDYWFFAYGSPEREGYATREEAQSRLEAFAAEHKFDLGLFRVAEKESR